MNGKVGMEEMAEALPRKAPPRKPWHKEWPAAA